MKLGPKVLVIDDDPGLLTLVQAGLTQDDFQVLTANGGREGLRMAYDNRPDVILLDIMMPEMDGFEVCQRLRHVCDTPILMLTAKSDRQDVIKGLTMGADDYITKPFNLDELKARVHTILRRAGPKIGTSWRSVYDDGHLRIDLTDGTVARDGEEIHLAPTESRLLMYLVSQKGRTVPQEELLTSVWGPQCATETGYLSVYVRYLRRKIEDDPSNPRYVRTRWGVGYFFDGDGVVQQESH
jgi:two-component system KDP operon response regulator KdpE